MMMESHSSGNFPNSSSITLIGRDEGNIFLVTEYRKPSEKSFIHCIQIGVSDIENIEYDNTCLKQILSKGHLIATVDLSNQKNQFQYENIVQGSLSPSAQYLGFVECERTETKNEDRSPVILYRFHLLDLHTLGYISVNVESQLLINVKFLYSNGKTKLHSSDHSQEKFLILVHKQGVTQYSISKSQKALDEITVDPVIGRFLWCEWDLKSQCLYVLHLRQPVQTNDDDIAPRPTISCLQFHQSLPWETIFHIPLDLPHIQELTCDEDSAYPSVLPINIMANNKTNIKALSKSSGAICICLQHMGIGGLSLGYDILLLHHREVVSYCNGNSGTTGKILFSFYGSNHLIVSLPDSEYHLLQVGLTQEPVHHIKIKKQLLSYPVNSWDHHVLSHNYKESDSVLYIHSKTTNLVQKLSVSTEDLLAEFGETDLHCVQLAILNLFLQRGHSDLILDQMLEWIGHNQMDLQVTRLFKEFLIGSTYYSLKSSLASDAFDLMNSLSYTAVDTMTSLTKFVQRKKVLSSSLWMLSPNLRVVSPIEDIWTRLWANTQLQVEGVRFDHEKLAEKLLLSMDTCQPDALSRATTPITPSDSPLVNITSQYRDDSEDNGLPFIERETYSFNQVEYLLSVNLREVSVHLLKMNPNSSPLMIHQIASQYVDEQVQKVRLLCTKIFAYFKLGKFGVKGFDLIRCLDNPTVVSLYELLEKYLYSIESLAFPRPEGFLSFLTYLGYLSMDFSDFMENINRGVLHLNLEIVLLILQGGDSSESSLDKKIEVLTHLPSARARHALKFWDHPLSCTIQAKEHVESILSGKAFRKHRTVTKVPARTCDEPGLAAFPSAEGYSVSPLDTFLDLLTAKVDIRMLNLGLLVQAIQESIADTS